MDEFTKRTLALLVLSSLLVLGTAPVLDEEALLASVAEALARSAAALRSPRERKASRGAP